MTFQQVRNALIKLGESFKSWSQHEDDWFKDAYVHNNWFTPANLRLSLSAWSDQLVPSVLNAWLSSYDIKENKADKIAIIMAGNIPLVGLHDLLTVLLSGNHAIVKLSAHDKVMMEKVINELIHLETEMSGAIHISEERLPSTFDAVIATGSNNTNRYFEYYFRNKPHLFRKGRTSLAVLTGHETSEDLRLLGDDVFSYFGLGCRNVSGILVPKGYDFKEFFEAIEPAHEIMQHNKYMNNYGYHKTIFLMNGDRHLDNGFLLLLESENIFSPLGVLNYRFYDDELEVNSFIEKHRDSLQCLIGKTPGHIPFGKAQFPALHDYADNTDSMKFCLELKEHLV